MGKKLSMKKGDILVIAAALLLAFFIWIAFFMWRNETGNDGLVANIYIDGHLTHTIEVGREMQELRLESAAGYNVLQIGPDGVRISEADCSNQDCVRTGLQTRPGGVIACLPHRLLVSLSGGKEAGFDAVTW